MVPMVRYMRRRAVSLSTLVVAATLAAPDASAQTPRPSLVVVLRSDKAGPVLGIIDPVAGKIAARVPIGIDPHCVAVSADGKLAFVANSNSHNQFQPGGDSISVIDLAARKEVHRVPIGEGARAHDVRVAGGKVYFSAEGYKAIGRYDPARNKVDWLLGLGQKGPHMLVVSSDLNTIFAANHGSNNVSVVDAAEKGPSGWDVTQLPVGKGAEGIDISPDGKEVWTANEESGGISIIDVAKRVVQNVDLQTQHANRLKFTPDGTRVLLIDRETAELVVVDAGTRKVVKKIRVPGSAPASAALRESVSDFAVSPDSSRAFVTVNAPAGSGRSYIAAIDLRTFEPTSRIETETAGDSIAWVQPK
jgi:YVTN family beta-propeller protein